MKIFVTILKVLMVILTGSIAIFLGVLGAISVLVNSSQTPDADPGYKVLAICWISISVICYIIPTFLVMLNKYKVAAGMSIVGMIGVLVMYGTLGHLNGYVLYLPLIFITIVIVLIAVFANWDKIHNGIADKERKKNAPAPSLLGGTTQYSETNSDIKKHK